ncbi:MAG: hypothetical protein IJT94_16305 [Oscillibacter sp.]|nr:hypothetical protein [Oscillibacter sp.]
MEQRVARLEALTRELTERVEKLEAQAESARRVAEETPAKLAELFRHPGRVTAHPATDGTSAAD